MKDDISNWLFFNVHAPDLALDYWHFRDLSPDNASDYQRDDDIEEVYHRYRILMKGGFLNQNGFVVKLMQPHTLWGKKSNGYPIPTNWIDSNIKKMMSADELALTGIFQPQPW
jgi:hypothetical protein